MCKKKKSKGMMRMKTLFRPFKCWITMTVGLASHVSSLGSGKPRHPMRNSRLLFLVRRLSFTLSTKYCGLSLLDVSNMLTLVRITVDFAPANVDVSLKDFPPASSEAVLPLLSFLFVTPLLHFCRRVEFFLKKTKK